MSKIINFKRALSSKNFYSFVNGHNYLSSDDILKLKNLKNKDNKKITEKYEKNFSKIIGKGRSVSFSSGRMGFYSLMKIINIKKDDHVMIIGSTCAVMVTAILKIGAKPIFYDIDKRTLGSCLKEIKKKITKKTKMIVAQHSFGIPCEIDKISSYCRMKKIFLLEDCALTFDAKFKKIKIGNFGDASLFSTDHSKPVNTITGGIIYTNKLKYFSKLKLYQKNIPILEKEKVKKLYRHFLLEIFFQNPKKYKFLFLINFFIRFLPMYKNSFLDEDFDNFKNTSYAYPSKQHSFFSYLGILELREWNNKIKNRKKIFNQLILLFKEKKLTSLLPKSYFDSNKEISPLRFVWFSKNHRKKIHKLVDPDWIWFKKPIESTNLNLLKLQYKKGTCKQSEKLGKIINNLPCNFDPKFNMCFTKDVSEFLNGN